MNGIFLDILDRISYRLTDLKGRLPTVVRGARYSFPAKSTDFFSAARMDVSRADCSCGRGICHENNYQISRTQSESDARLRIAAVPRCPINICGVCNEVMGCNRGEGRGTGSGSGEMSTAILRTFDRAAMVASAEILRKRSLDGKSSTYTILTTSATHLSNLNVVQHHRLC